MTHLPTCLRFISLSISISQALLSNDIDAAHPVRLGLRVSEIDLFGRREFANDRLRHVVEKEEGHESEAVALLEVATVLGPALVGLAELVGDRLPRIHCVCLRSNFRKLYFFVRV